MAILFKLVCTRNPKEAGFSGADLRYSAAILQNNLLNSPIGCIGATSLVLIVAFSLTGILWVSTVATAMKPHMLWSIAQCGPLVGALISNEWDILLLTVPIHPTLSRIKDPNVTLMIHLLLLNAHVRLLFKKLRTFPRPLPLQTFSRPPLPISRLYPRTRYHPQKQGIPLPRPRIVSVPLCSFVFGPLPRSNLRPMQRTRRYLIARPPLQNQRF